MVLVYGELEKLVGNNTRELPLDSTRIRGSPIDIFNFADYVRLFALTETELCDTIISGLNDPLLDTFSPKKIRDMQTYLIKKQVAFAYETTPAIHFLWKEVFGIHPDDIKSIDDFQKVPPVTKEHQRLLGWQNFIPAPIADYYLNGVPGGVSKDEIDPNLVNAQDKWTGGTSATHGRDYVQIVIPLADWRASVDTMERLLRPVEHIVRDINIAGTQYDMRHIARPIFEAQLARYGKSLLAMPPGANDDAWLQILQNMGISGGVAPPVDHPLKGLGWPGMLYGCGDQFKLALMSSTIPTDELLRGMLENGMAILNVGGDTGSLPTYYALANPHEYDRGDPASVKGVLAELTKLHTIPIAPAYTEIVSPVDLTPSMVGEEGILLQTNYASVWHDQDTGEKYIVPAMKSQMIRSSATGNLVRVMDVDDLDNPNRFHHQILRYKDFKLDKNLMPKYENPHSSGGSSRGGCAG